MTGLSDSRSSQTHGRSAIARGQSRIHSTRMAFKTILLPFLCFLVSSTAEQNCSECSLSPVGEDLSSEFQLKASEKGVKLVYLQVKITGNDSYGPLNVQDEFLPDWWVYARSISEPMLSLPYDYDALSLGLLNYQVRSMIVPLKGILLDAL